MLSPKLLLILLLFAAIYCAEAKESQKPDLSGSQNIINQTPAYFIENKGQWDDAIKFRANLNGTTAFICKNNVVFDFYRLYNEPTDVKNEDNRRIEGHVVNLDYSASARQDFKGLKKLDYFHNYFIGNDSTKWARHVTLYQEVIVENFSEGIDARFYFENGMLRYDFIVKPGANLHDLSLKFDMGKGYDNSLFVNECGELVMKTSLGEIINGQLAAYQFEGNVKRPVDCAFNIETNNQAGFVLGEFDKGEELVIDPLVWSGFLSSNNIGQLNGNCIKADISVYPDEEGIYICGSTVNFAFPTTQGAYYCLYCADQDCFLTKIDASGYPDQTNMPQCPFVYSTFFGGTSFDIANDMCIYQRIGGDWKIIITGSTASDNFPIPISGVKQESHSGTGTNDAFVAVFSTNLGELTISTYLGGTSNDEGKGIKAYQGRDYTTLNGYTPLDIIVVVGYTTSDDFPVRNSIPYFGLYNGFIAYYSFALNDADFSSCYFNANTDVDAGIKINGLDIDPDYESDYIKGEFYIVGSTIYSDALYGEDIYNNRIGTSFMNTDCIIVKAHRFNYNSYLNNTIGIDQTYRIGGINNEYGTSIKYTKLTGLDPYIFITGFTNSLDFAGSSINVLNTSLEGAQDAFVARLNATYPTTLPRIGYYGHLDCTTSGNSITVGSYDGRTSVSDWSVNIVGTLSTTNSNNTIPVTNEIDGSLGYKGYNDAFIARFTYNLDSVKYHAYFGGPNEDDWGLSIDMNYHSELFFTGNTLSSDFPVTYNSFNPNNSSSSTNCFVSKISGLDYYYNGYNNNCTPAITAPNDNSCMELGQDIVFQIAFDGTVTPNNCLTTNNEVKIEIQISTDDNFLNPTRFEFDWNDNGDGNFGIYTISHTFTNNLIADNTTYYWRALAISPQITFPASNVIRLRTNYTQTIPIVAQTWQIISSNCNPFNPNVENIWNGNSGNLITMKDGEGNFYVPSFYINNIGDWNIQKGYWVYTTSNVDLPIIGCKIIQPESTAIDLSSGWNLISYLRDDAASIETNLASIRSNITIAKDQNGYSWVPSLGIDNINYPNQPPKYQVPGQGYQIYMTAPATLYYPANSSRIIGVIENDTSPLPVYLIPITNVTGNDASLIINNSNIPDDFEVGIWNSNWELIGSGRIHNGVTALTIWGDNESTETIDGALPFENLNIKVFNYQTGQLLNANLSNLHEITRDTFPTNLYYEKHAIFETSANINLPNTQTYFNLTCLPNPFHESATISYYLTDVSNVTLTITDNLGNIITTLVNNESQSSGSHNITLNSTNIQTGVYFCTLTSDEHTETIQILIVQ